MPTPHDPPCIDRAVAWARWHVAELVGVTVPLVLAATVATWLAALSVLVAGLWIAKEVRLHQRARALTASHTPAGASATSGPTTQTRKGRQRMSFGRTMFGSNEQRQDEVTRLTKSASRQSSHAKALRAEAAQIRADEACSRFPDPEAAQAITQHLEANAWIAEANARDMRQMAAEVSNNTMSTAAKVLLVCVLIALAYAVFHIYGR